MKYEEELKRKGLRVDGMGAVLTCELISFGGLEFVLRREVGSTATQ